MSPCIGICQMDEDNRYCIGCGRTMDEIASWGSTTDEARAQTMAELADRQQIAGTEVDPSRR